MSNQEYIVKIYHPLHTFSTKTTISIVLSSLAFIKNSSNNFIVFSGYTDTPIDVSTANPNNKVIIIDPKTYMKEEFFKTDPKIAFNDYIFVRQNIDDKKFIEQIAKEINILIEKNIKIKAIEVELELDYAIYLSKILTNIPIIYVSHLPLVKRDFIRSMFKATKLFFKIKQLSGFIFVSNFYKNHFIKYFYLLRKKAFMVHNSYDHIQNLIPQTYPKKENIVIFVGRASKAKGIEEFFLFAGKFLKNNNTYKCMAILNFQSNKELTFYNKIMENEDVQNAIKNNKLEILKDVPNTDVFKYLLKSKVCVLPTLAKLHKEGIPMISLESIMAKALTITSTSGGFVEINPFKELQIEKVSVENILNKINFLTQNEELITKYQEQQYNFVKNNFNINNLSKSFDIARNNIINTFNKKRKNGKL